MKLPYMAKWKACVNSFITELVSIDLIMQGSPPLDLAVMGGHLEAIQFLLSHKAKQKRNKQDKRFPLHIAVNGEFEFTRKFFRHLLECEYTNNYDKVMRFDDATLRASEKEVLSIVECLLENGGQVNKKDSKRETPLYFAVRKQYSEVTKLLIEHGTEVDIMNEIGLCPLHYAAGNQVVAIAQALIEQGASVNCESIRGDTPLRIAVVNKRPMMASFLWDRSANILGGNPPAVILLLNSEYETVMQPFILHILETDKNINERKDNSFDCVLRSIMATRNLSIIRIALQQKILDANYRIQNANMAVLGLATSWGLIETVKLLIEYGADVNMPVHARKKTKGKTPLHYAARRGSVEIAKLLIEHGADINAKSSRGNTPLKYALKHQHKDMIQFLEEHRAVAE
jgi:ankyrin repeat protein